MEQVRKEVNSFIQNIKDNVEEDERGTFQKLDGGYSGEDVLILYYEEEGKKTRVELKFAIHTDLITYSRLKESGECIGYVFDGEFFLQF